MPTRLPSHEELGITHELTGLEMAIDSLIRRRDGLLARLQELQEPAPAPPVPKVTLVLPAANGKRLHPRDKDHPDHERWIKKLRKMHRNHWDSLSPAERQRRVAKMQAGRS